MSKRAPRTLFEALGMIRDTRDPRGLRLPAQFMLAVTVAAMLSGRKNLLAVAEWVRDQDRAFLRQMGMVRYHPPSKSSFYDFFKTLDIVVFELLLAGWLQEVSASSPGLQRISLDGKTLRGSARKHGEVPGVHLISAYLQQPGCVLAQRRVEDKTNEHKAALEMIKTLILDKVVIVGDAIYCQKDLSKAILKGGGDYFWVVKDNQPELKDAITGAFAAPVSPPRDKALAG